VVLVAVLSSFVLAYLGHQVGSARKKFKVDLPSLYADQAAAEKDKDKYLFNCYQRGHQNALETYPSFLTCLLLGGLKHPVRNDHQISIGYCNRDQQGQ
jgi:glutathione S-transferase